MEDKFPPYVTSTGYPEYCNVYPVQEHIYPYLDFQKLQDITLSRKQSLYCKFVDERQSYTFGQYFPEGGVYETTLVVVSGPVFGDLDIMMDDRPVGSIVVDHRSGHGLVEQRFEVEVSEGLHTFEIAPRPDSLPERSYFMLDFIRFEKKGNGV